MEVTHRKVMNKSKKSMSGMKTVRKGDTKTLTAKPATVPPKKSAKPMLSSDSAIKKKPSNVRKVIQPASTKLSATGHRMSRKK